MSEAEKLHRWDKNERVVCREDESGRNDLVTPPTAEELLEFLAGEYGFSVSDEETRTFALACIRTAAVTQANLVAWQEGKGRPESIIE